MCYNKCVNREILPNHLRSKGGNKEFTECLQWHYHPSYAFVINWSC